MLLRAIECRRCILTIAQQEAPVAKSEIMETHPWIRKIIVTYVPGKDDGRINWLLPALLDWFGRNGHTVQDDGPTDETDLIITSAIFGQPVERGDALLFQAKRRFRLSTRPQVLTLMSIEEAELQSRLLQFEELARHPLDAESAKLQFPGMGPEAVEVLHSQAGRGPIVALGRYLQAQAKSIRVLALVGDDTAVPSKAIHFDLAGSHAETSRSEVQDFAADVGRRLVVHLSTHEVKDHEFIDDAVPAELWKRLRTPTAMVRAGPLFTEFGFFIDPILVEKALGFKGISDVIAAQYSEGCYAAYDADLQGLISTATGSARLVDKRSISHEDLAYVVGVKRDGGGALVRAIEGRPVVVPSVEAVELWGICDAVSRQTIKNSLDESVEVPTVRAILHGHVGVAAYDPQLVERITLDRPFYHYPVSCGTHALAEGTAAAFASSESLRDPDDPRKVIFLEQPCHGVLVAEKWAVEMEAFETIYDSLRSKSIQMTPEVPQGPIAWRENNAVLEKV